MKRPPLAYLLRHPRSIALDLRDSPDPHRAVRRSCSDETPVPAEVAEEDGVVALHGAGSVLQDVGAVREREDAELALREVSTGVRIGGVDGFGVPGVDESVIARREEKFVDGVVAELVDEAVMDAAGSEVVIAGLGGAVGEERRDVPEHDPSVLAAAHQKRIGVVDDETGDFAAMAADGAAGMSGKRGKYMRFPDWMSQILMR